MMQSVPTEMQLAERVRGVISELRSVITSDITAIDGVKIHQNKGVTKELRSFLSVRSGNM